MLIARGRQAGRQMGRRVRWVRRAVMRAGTTAGRSGAGCLPAGRPLLPLHLLVGHDPAGACPPDLPASACLPDRLTAPACAVMEMAAGGSLTSYVADKWQKAQQLGLFLSEDEARFFFKVQGRKSCV